MSEIVPFDLTTALEDSADSSLELEVDDYDQVFEDFWVGVALAVLVLSCVGCLCTAFFFHTFKQWQRRVLETRNVESGYDTESLPSYTVVAGLPTYEEAIEQLKRATGKQGEASHPHSDSPPNFSKLSVGDLLEIYKVNLEKK